MDCIDEYEDGDEKWEFWQSMTLDGELSCEGLSDIIRGSVSLTTHRVRKR